MSVLNLVIGFALGFGVTFAIIAVFDLRNDLRDLQATTLAHDAGLRALFDHLFPGSDWNPRAGIWFTEWANDQARPEDIEALADLLGFGWFGLPKQKGDDQ